MKSCLRVAGGNLVALCASGGGARTLQTRGPVSRRRAGTSTTLGSATAVLGFATVVVVAAISVAAAAAAASSATATAVAAGSHGLDAFIVCAVDAGESSGDGGLGASDLLIVVEEVHERVGSGLLFDRGKAGEDEVEETLDGGAIEGVGVVAGRGVTSGDGDGCGEEGQPMLDPGVAGTKLAQVEFDANLPELNLCVVLDRGAQSVGAGRNRRAAAADEGFET